MSQSNKKGGKGPPKEKKNDDDTKESNKAGALRKNFNKIYAFS